MKLESLEKTCAVALLIFAVTGCTYVPAYTSEGVTGGRAYESESATDHEPHHNDYPLSLAEAHYYSRYYYPYSYYGLYVVPPRAPNPGDSLQPEPAPETDSRPPAEDRPRSVPGSDSPRTEYRSDIARPRAGSNIRRVPRRSTATRPTATRPTASPAAPVRTPAPRRNTDSQAGRLNRR